MSDKYEMVEAPADLGYQWSVGEISDLEVLAMCLGTSVYGAECFIQKEGHHASMVDQARTWKATGFVFDWALDPDNHRIPFGVKNQLDKL